MMGFPAYSTLLSCCCWLIGCGGLLPAMRNMPRQGLDTASTWLLPEAVWHHELLMPSTLDVTARLLARLPRGYRHAARSETGHDALPWETRHPS